MCGEVVRPKVSLDLDQPAPQTGAVDLADKHLAQQLARDRDRVAIEELQAEDGADGIRAPLSQTRPGPGRGRPSCGERGDAACPRKGPCPPPRTSTASSSPAARTRPRCLTRPEPAPRTT